MYKPVKKLLRFDNYKMSKSTDYGYLSVILYLAPHTLSGKIFAHGLVRAVLKVA